MPLKFLGKFNLVDWLNFAYFGYLTTVLIVKFREVPSAGWLLAAHAAYIALMTVLALTVRPDSHRVFRFIRSFYQIMCVTLIYRETEFFMRLYHNHWLDPFVALTELKIFGFYPNLLLEKIATPPLTEVLKFCYSSYFFLLPLVPLFLWTNRRTKGFYYYMFASTLSLYLCYVGFTIFPVQGPRYFFSPSMPPGEILLFPWAPNTQGVFFRDTRLHGYFFTWFVDTAMRYADAMGACIPSAHAGAATVILGVFRRYLKRGYPFALPLIVGVLLSTVYNRYHYVTDMVSGVLVGVLVLVISDIVFRLDRGYKYIKE